MYYNHNVNNKKWKWKEMKGIKKKVWNYAFSGKIEK